MTLSHKMICHEGCNKSLISQTDHKIFLWETNPNPMPDSVPAYRRRTEFIWQISIAVGRPKIIIISPHHKTANLHQKLFENYFLWSPYVIGQTIIFLPCYFYLLSSFFPRLISAAAGWMSTIDTWCGPSANLECRYERCCMRLAANAGPKSRQKSPSGHHPTTLSGYIFATKACIDNRKKTC